MFFPLPERILLAVAMAKHGTPGGETTLEGDAGFYHAYTGNNFGQLRYSFTGHTSTDLARITEVRVLDPYFHF